MTDIKKWAKKKDPPPLEDFDIKQIVGKARYDRMSADEQKRIKDDAVARRAEEKYRLEAEAFVRNLSRTIYNEAKKGKDYLVLGMVGDATVLEGVKGKLAHVIRILREKGCELKITPDLDPDVNNNELILVFPTTTPEEESKHGRARGDLSKLRK